LSQYWSQVSFLTRTAQHVLLLLDFDGTLAPLCDRPEDVQLGNATRQVLRRLASHRRISIAVVSGRRRVDLRERIGVPGVQYFGLHGWEEREGMSLSCHSQWLLLSARVWVGQRLGLPGVRVEDKEMSLAVHFRKAPVSAIRDLRSGIRDIVEMLGPEGLHVIEGSNVLELLPPEIQGKGAAVRNIVNGLRVSLPIYLGDDPSDESAFAALPSGITIRVGRTRRTAARYSLRDTKEVGKFLTRLEAKLS
jgi:trehalose-phosphatase